MQNTLTADDRNTLPIQPTKIRDASVDNAKGILIILVVVGHLNFLDEMSVLVRTIYLFHMPAFLALGCLFTKAFTWSAGLQRLKRLMIPFVFVSACGYEIGQAIMFGTMAAMGKGNIGPDPKLWIWIIILSVTLVSTILVQIPAVASKVKLYGSKALLYIWISGGVFTLSYNLLTNQWHDGFTFWEKLLWSNWQHERTQFWFLPALWSCSVTFSVWLLLPRWLGWLAFIPLYVLLVKFMPVIQHFTIEIVWELDIAVYMLPLIAITYWLYRNGSGLVKNENKLIVFAAFSFLLSLVASFYLIPTYVYGPEHVDVSAYLFPRKYTTFGLVYVVSACFCFLMFRFRRSTWLSVLGQHTMPIFFLHVALLVTLHKVIDTSQFPWWVVVLLFCSISVALPVFIGKALYKIDTRFSYLGLGIG